MEAISPAAGVDRISQLPAKIIHLILHSLDSHKSAARTSILSRTWLHLWTTYPYVEFKDIGVNFESFASATSKRLRLAGPPLDTFTVTLGSLGDVMMGRGKERRELYGKNLYPSLHELLSSGSSRSPIRVSVKNYLHSNVEFVLFRLATRITWCMTKGLIVAESLWVGEPNGFKLELSSAHLLDNFSFSGSFTFLNVVSAPNVKSVELQPDYDLKCGEIEELISKFPSLESLGLSAGRLTSRDNNRKIRISTHTLRKLTLRYLCSAAEIEIDAPNLEILTIEASKLDIKCNVVNVVSVAPSCRFVFGCLRSGMTIGTSWLIELRKVVKAFAARFRHLVFKLELDLRFRT
ncbi:hypothetical protein LINGRAHAP2_LOCUS1234, partial [Linum grandiflorum]